MQPKYCHQFRSNYVLALLWVIVAFCVGVIAAPAAEDPFIEPAVWPSTESEPTPDCKCVDCKCDPCECKTEQAELLRPRVVDVGQQMQIDQLALRLDRLETSQIDRAEVKQIAEAAAEAVYQRYATKLELQIKTAAGGERSQVVNFASPSQSATFDLAPGESLVSYTDSATGQVIQCGQPATLFSRYGQPVAAYQLPAAEARVVTNPGVPVRRVFMRPIVETFGQGTYSRGVVGGSCRIINGRKVCN